MKQNLVADADVKQNVRMAIQKMALLVGSTLGPGGRPVMISRDDRGPLITKDGVTVAEAYRAPGLEGTVVDAAREVCQRSASQTGDGTTTAIVLASALVENGEKEKINNPQAFAREMWATYSSKVKPILEGMSKPIRGLDRQESEVAVKHVAMVSANHDEGIANAVTEAIGLVGDDGVVQVEEGAGAEIRVEHKEGFPMDIGFAKLGASAESAFINRQGHSDCAMDGCLVCLYDGDINEINVLLPLMEKVAADPTKPPIVVFAHAFGDHVLKALAQNFRRGILLCVPVLTPRNGQAHGRSEILHDLSAYTGGQVFDPIQNPLGQAHVPQLGFVESVRIGMHDTILLGEPELDKVEKRIAELKERMVDATEFDKERMRFRIGRLTGGVAILYAGGTTALEAQERRDRAVDAVSAVRCALDKGVVPGGGVALMHAVKKLNHTSLPERVLMESLCQPFLQILKNSGLTHDEAIDAAERVLKSENIVYDAVAHDFVDWWSSGILDPLRVTISAVENALSVAQLLITLGGVIVDELTDNEHQAKAFQSSLTKVMEQAG